MSDMADNISRQADQILATPPPSHRRSCGKSWPWRAVVNELQCWLPDHAPLLELSRVLAASEVAAKLFPGVSYAGLFITDEPDFYWDDNVLVVTYQPELQRFRLQYRLAGKISLERFCPEADILPALASLLPECFGVIFQYG